MNLGVKSRISFTLQEALKQRQGVAARHALLPPLHSAATSLLFTENAVGVNKMEMKRASID